MPTADYRCNIYSNRKALVVTFRDSFPPLTQALLLSGCVDGSHVGSLPQNVRVISNFFKAGPDGTVRAFTAPIVHERCKNASTARSVIFLSF